MNCEASGQNFMFQGRKGRVLACQGRKKGPKSEKGGESSIGLVKNELTANQRDRVSILMVCVIYVSHSPRPIYRVLLEQRLDRSSRCPIAEVSALTFRSRKDPTAPDESLNVNVKIAKEGKETNESRRRHYFRNENVSNENLPKGARAKWWS